MGEVTDNPHLEYHNCTCIPLNITNSFLRKSEEKTHPENKVAGTEKRGSVGYRETESRDQLMEELITEKRRTCE